MALDYNVDERVKDIAAVLDKYSGWFMQVVRFLSYPANVDGSTGFPGPQSFNRWVKEAKTSGLDAAVIKKLNALQADLNEEAQALVSYVQKNQKSPDYAKFDKLVMLFEEFSHHIRRLEIDMFFEDSGIDAVTGLRSDSVFRDDIKREMDRLARQGKVFSLALLRIDDLDGLKKHNNEDAVNRCFKSVAGMIRRSVRSFDDAYRLDGDEFLLSLKQADMSGGIRVMERLKKEAEKKDVTYKIDGKDVHLSLSSCIAEPMPGDDIEALLANLRNDIDRCGKEGGAVLEYFEMSPLQRYAKNIQE